MSRSARLHAEREPLIIAHRGASADAPENTLAAFKLAFEQGADGIEFDVRLARDLVPVCIHDATLERTARRAGLVSAFTSDELSKIDVGSWLSATSKRDSHVPFYQEAVPTLSQVFELTATRAKALYVEMKFERGEDCRRLAEKVSDEIKSFRLEDCAVVESFNLESIRYIKQIAPELRTAALFERALIKPLASRKWILERALEARADELALHHSLASSALIEAARAIGLPSIVWTVDAASWVDKACALGLRALITNRPAQMRARLDALRTG